MSKSEIVKQYIELRDAEKNDELLELFADDCSVTSKGKKHAGKEGVAAYFKDEKPKKSEWQEPEEDGNKVVLKGKVRVLMMWWNVQATYEFDSDDKITSVVVERV
eukprot:CAMPEP_0174250186 /NCGR_PEP_ID=MMETSP0439-20130205/439_1 /TAXON_ID=0 /ORGANISM="Stereomyxa ramosa, Strain Chinc5" /LENGTH=104 /DNA_ID=CAMNT_0015330189 /DNA_START=13 /DNA_END=327 /DNA_ORIENTATION=+